jgi:hypothetical protein
VTVQTEARAPVRSTDWFGNRRFIGSKLSGQNFQTRSDRRPCHCAEKVTAKDAKHTKRNPCLPGNEPENPQKATKETKIQAAPSFSPFPSVQNLRALTPNS